MRIALLSALAFTLLLIGCGGGGGGGSSTTSGSGSGTSGGSGTGPSGYMSDKSRAPIVAAAVAAYASLPQTNGVVDSNALLVAANKISGLKGMTITLDGNVTGHFSDGLPFTFFNNRTLSLDSNGKRSARVGGQKTVTSNKPRTLSQGLSSVQLLDSEDPIFVVEHTVDDAEMFANHGYGKTGLTQSTVEAYRALANTTLGVLDMSGHGGICEDTSGNALGYSIWTATPAVLDPSSPNYNGQLYDADLADFSLGLGVANSGINSTTGNPIPACHYCLTKQFIQKYKWQFASRSYVTLSVCSGMSAPASGFRQMLYARGASMVMGWTNSVPGDIDYHNNSYAFDRMLGANTVDPAKIPRRPFAITDVLAALGRAGTISVEGHKGNTQWQMEKPSNATNATTFEVLNPSIQYAYVLETTNGLSSKLIVAGYFNIPGSSPPKLSIGGASLSLSSDQPGLIEAPATPQQYGKVLATVTDLEGNDLVSNPRFLSFWTGNISETTTYKGNTSGATVITFNMNVHIRGDIGSTYYAADSAGPTPVQSGSSTSSGQPLYSIPGEKSDTCSVSASGTAVDETIISGMVVNTTSTALSGGGTVTNSGAQGIFSTFFSIPPDNTHPAFLQILVDSKNFLNETITLSDSQGTTTSSNPANADFSTEYFLGSNGNTWLPMVVDAEHNIQGASYPLQGEVMGEWAMTLSPMKCQSPPDETSAR